MTGIAGIAFRDGFLTGLVWADRDSSRNSLSVAVALFDGGRCRAELHRSGDMNDPGIRLELRLFLAPLIPPPHVLAHCGRGASRLLAESLGAHLPLARLLDLRATALAFRPGVPARAPVSALAEAYGVSLADPGDDEPEGTDPAARSRLRLAFWSELLWRIVAEADRRNLDWPGLMAAAATERIAVPFERFDFDAASITALPQSPGVYLMRERGGAVLYVGKSGHLRRRLGEYFRRQRTLPAKLERLRARIHTIEYRSVGSDLEAILWEHRTIGRLKPLLNVQRQVHPRRGVHAAALAAAVLVPSVDPGAVELFVIRFEPPVVQCRLRRGRTGAESIRKMLALALESPARLARRRHTVLWEAEEAELARRYWTLQRHRLTWTEITTPEATAGPLSRLIRSDTGLDPAWLRTLPGGEADA